MNDILNLRLVLCLGRKAGRLQAFWKGGGIYQSYARLENYFPFAAALFRPPSNEDLPRSLARLWGSVARRSMKLFPLWYRQRKYALDASSHANKDTVWKVTFKAQNENFFRLFTRLQFMRWTSKTDSTVLIVMTLDVTSHLWLVCHWTLPSL
jgi:hypothetical protein